MVDNTVNNVGFTDLPAINSPTIRGWLDPMESYWGW